MLQQPTTPLTLMANKYALAKTAQALLAYASDYNVWVFKGDLGAGKTTLISAICNQLGVQEHVTSPTFSLINEYTLPTGGLIYHMDAYRLHNERDMVELDYAFYLDNGTYCFIEWPEKLIPLLHAPYLEVQLQSVAIETRQIVATIIDNTTIISEPLPTTLYKA